MPDSRMAQECAQVILNFYKSANLRPGQALMHQGIEYEFVTERLGTVEEFKAGMKFAVAHKWILLRNGQAYLTPEGFAVMGRPRTSGAAPAP